ncbi:MAG TPA: PQQ-dependent sugar dehydrogenase [Longimicrobiales bacterium]|nr:PQQ-dependent sugar dehydrogenase [Longimicrobiales bacterium]
MRICSLVPLSFLLLACAEKNAVRTGPCDSDNAGLKLPAGFCARVYADKVGAARHLAVAANGDVWVALQDAGGIIVLRDRNGDGRADTTVKVFSEAGSGIALLGDTLWFSTPSTVYRFRIDPSRFGGLLDKTVIVHDMPTGGHSSRSLALGDSTILYANVGSDSNVCGGEDPCVELSTRASIWKFDRNTQNQTQFEGERFASGIRNAVGLVWNENLHSLFATQHGRDGLDDEDLPSEVFVRVTKGADYGWPYCYHDWRRNKNVLAPEYSGDGAKEGRCTSAAKPLMGFPGHWAPNGLIFYNGSMFPARYQGGAFIAFHGSWNRRHHDGYKVAFVPFNGAMPAGDYEIFADGFAGRRKSPSGARHRPVGMAVARDGSLYITDDQRGRIYNVRWNESKNDSPRGR